MSSIAKGKEWLTVLSMNFSVLKSEAVPQLLCLLFSFPFWVQARYLAEHPRIWGSLMLHCAQGSKWKLCPPRSFVPSRHTMSICLTTGDVNADPLVHMASASLPLFLQIINLLWEDTWRLCIYPVSHQVSPLILESTDDPLLNQWLLGNILFFPSWLYLQNVHVTHPLSPSCCYQVVTFTTVSLVQGLLRNPPASTPSSSRHPTRGKVVLLKRKSARITILFKPSRGHQSLHCQLTVTPLLTVTSPFSRWPLYGGSPSSQCPHQGSPLSSGVSPWLLSPVTSLTSSLLLCPAHSPPWPSCGPLAMPGLLLS